VNGAAAALMMGIDLRIIARRRWILGVTLCGLVYLMILATIAADQTGQTRADTFQSNCASLLLIGGLIVAVGLGAGAFSRDTSSGYLGLLVGSGATPGRVGAVRILTRLAALIAILALWGVAIQLASLALGRGVDGPLMVHTVAWVVNCALVLCASAALASVIGPVAAGVFGLLVFVCAQAVVNLKADLDQGAVSRGSQSFIDSIYSVLPRAIVSPMLADLQRRGHAGPAAPDININGLAVVVPASRLVDVLWTLLWILIFAALATYGVRRRQL
jgi:ABC-type transport system involved in multi-copper enzyme maturation permease subunit